MEKTWAAGPIELMAHAHSHLDYDSPFDRRIAYVSVDNAVELTLRTYLTLPKRFFKGSQPPRLDEGADFRDLVDVVFNFAGAELGDIRRSELLKLHELRNVIYHRSPGSDVDSRFLARYLEIGSLLMRLLGADIESGKATLASFRADLIAELEKDLREERRARHSQRVTKGMRRVSAQGRNFGRPRKLLTPDEALLAARLNSELGWGALSIAREINNRRGSHLIASRGARLDAGVSTRIVREHLKTAGTYQKGTSPGKQPRRVPEGFK